MENLQDFMNWMAGPGIVYLVGIVMSLIASKFPQWDNLAREIKIVVPVVLAVAIGFAVRALNIPVITNDPNLNFAFYTILYYLATQKQHEANQKNEYLREIRQQDLELR